MAEYPRYELVGLTRDAGSPIDRSAMMRKAQNKVDATLTPEQEHVSTVEPWGIDHRSGTGTRTRADTGTTITRHQSIYLYRVTITPTP